MLNYVNGERRSFWRAVGMQVRFASTPQRLNASSKALLYLSKVPANYYYVMFPRCSRGDPAVIPTLAGEQFPSVARLSRLNRSELGWAPSSRPPLIDSSTESRKTRAGIH